MIIVSFYTIGTPYEQEAAKLKASLAALAITNYDILGVPDKGSWNANTKCKPFVILRAMNRYDTDVLFVDADATFEQVPAVDPDADLAAHVMDKQFWGQDTRRRAYSLMSGTLWFANSDPARDLLTAWQNENRLEPKRWDQHNLETVIGFDPRTKAVGGPWRLAELPCQYCAIDKTMTGINDAVIRHHQASRKLKGKIG